MAVIVTWVFFLHTFDFAVYILFQRFEGYMPVIWYAMLVAGLGIVIRPGILASNLQVVLVKEPGETIDIISNLIDNLLILATLIFLFVYALIQYAVFPNMTEPARDIIAFPVRIYPVHICFPDFIYFKCDSLREFLLWIILHAIGNG